MIVAYAARGRGGERMAALKMWDDDDGGTLTMATLYLPDEIFKWQSADDRVGCRVALHGEQRRPDGEEWPLPNPIWVTCRSSSSPPTRR